MKNISIDGARLWESLMEMAKIGATEKGGNCRLALTDLDRQGRDLFVRWCEAAGCTVSVDAIFHYLIWGKCVKTMFLKSL